MVVSDSDVERLRAAAVAASGHAYCPYSSFAVGAAVLTETGDVFAGCNAENASLGLTICAERSAIFHAIATGARRIRALLVFTPTRTPTPPCGACRQVIFEFQPDAEIYVVGHDGETQHHRLSDLLPEAFGPRNLETSV